MRPRVQELLHAVAGWAAAREDVRAVVLAGSQARSDAPADEFSDVDLALLVADPAPYLREREWVRAFGEPLLTFVEPTAVGAFEERRVLYRDGLEVDFSVLPASIADALPAEAADVLRRGHRVLYDEVGLRLDEIVASAEPAPTGQAELDQRSHDFRYHALWAAKKLRRGELLLAKQVCDCYPVARLVALARRRAHGSDTWHDVRFFERWARDDLLEALPPTFARYDAGDVARALRATGELFGRLEDEVAERFGLSASADRAELLRRLDGLVGELVTPEVV